MLTPVVTETRRHGHRIGDLPTLDQFSHWPAGGDPERARHASQVRLHGFLRHGSGLRYRSVVTAGHPDAMLTRH